MAKIKTKNLSSFDRDRYLNSFNIPQENVIDLKRILIEQEKAERAAKKPSVKGRLIMTFQRPSGLFKLPVNFRFRLNYQSLIVYAVILLALSLPFFMFWGFSQVNNTKGKVLGASTEALSYLKSASVKISEFNLNEARQDFAQAQESFTRAQGELDKVNKVLLTMVKLFPLKGQSVSSGEHLIAAGKDIAEIGEIVTDKIQPFLNLNYSDNENKLNLSGILSVLDTSVSDIVKRIENVKKNLEKVNVASLPEEYQDDISKIKDALPELTVYVDKMQKVFKVSTAILGGNGVKEFLLIFQNNRELRPTGGFIGSFALVDIDKGGVKIIEMPGKGSYDINDDLALNIKPPKPLWLVNNKWQMQDANWFPDFPSSAEKIDWFYEQARGFGADGVISFTPDIIIELLKITGPITMDTYQTVLTSDNFIAETQRQVEQEYDPEVNKPKQMIADLMPVLLNRIFEGDPKDLTKLLGVLNQALEDKNILIYVKDPTLESTIQELNWAGEIKQAEGDYLMVVDTNIAGGKTDEVIKEEISHLAKVEPDGTIYDTVTISRAHYGDENDPFTKIKNLDYLRVYVPSGSQFVSAEGFETIDQSLIIYPDAQAKDDQDLLDHEKNAIIDERTNTRITEEFGKTCFGNWLPLAVGEKKEVKITYKLPFKLGDKGVYTIYFQKQPGSFGAKLKTYFDAGESYQVTEEWPNGFTAQSGEITYNDSLIKDKAYALAIEKK